jgi:hypothetical protein
MEILGIGCIFIVGIALFLMLMCIIGTLIDNHEKTKTLWNDSSIVWQKLNQLEHKTNKQKRSKK